MRIKSFKLKKFLISLVVFSLLLFPTVKVAQAFSFLDFFNQLKEKLLNPQEEKIVKELKAKKETLGTTLNLIINNYNDEEQFLSDYCPLHNEEVSENSSSSQEKNYFYSLIETLYPKWNEKSTTITEEITNPVETSSSQGFDNQTFSTKQEKQTSTSSQELSSGSEKENQASTEKEFFESLPLEEKTNFLFYEKACKEADFIKEEKQWYQELKKEIDQIEDLNKINELTEKLKAHKNLLEDENRFSSELVAVINSLKNIQIAENRKGKIEKDLKEIKMDEFSREVISKLFLLAKTKIKVASLKTEKAKLIFLYLQSFKEIWPEEETASGSATSTTLGSGNSIENSTSSTNKGEKENETEKIEEEIALSLKLSKDNIQSPVELIKESQDYLKSAYQDFSLTSKIVNSQ